MTPKTTSLIALMPRFMSPDLSKVKTVEDLLAQINIEIDLAERGDIDPPWDPWQLRVAGVYASTVCIALLQEQRANGEPTK